MKKRLLMVGRSRYSLPLSPSLAQKFDALAAELDVRVLASSGGGGGDGPAFPARAARSGQGRSTERRSTCCCRSAWHVSCARSGRTPCSRRARRRRRSRARTHARARPDTSDRRRPRRLAAPRGCTGRRSAGARAARRRARAPGLRRSDGVRTISAYTSGLVREAGVEPTAEFPAFMDLEPFVERAPVPLPERAAALFVGVLERYKNVDVLADAWRLAAPRVPGATLHLVGGGTLRDVRGAPRRRPPGADAWTESLSTPEVARGARRRDRARAAVALGGSRPRRRRGVLPRPRRRSRRARRRHPRRRRGRRERPARPARRRASARRRARARPLRPCARRAARRAGAPRAATPGSRRRTSTPTASRELVDDVAGVSPGLHSLAMRADRSEAGR